jgi:hypothetical protein
MQAECLTIQGNNEKRLALKIKRCIIGIKKYQRKNIPDCLFKQKWL